MHTNVPTNILVQRTHNAHVNLYTHSAREHTFTHICTVCTYIKQHLMYCVILVAVQKVEKQCCLLVKIINVVPKGEREGELFTGLVGGYKAFPAEEQLLVHHPPRYAPSFLLTVIAKGIEAHWSVVVGHGAEVEVVKLKGMWKLLQNLHWNSKQQQGAEPLTFATYIGGENKHVCMVMNA